MKKEIEKLTDEEIIEKVINEDNELYYYIVKRYEKKLERYILRLTNRKDETEDILQNVFIKAYENLRKFNNKLKFSSWIYRIAHNESVNLIKSNFIQKFVSIENFIFSDSTNIEEQTIDKQLKEQLKKCIEKLDIKYKEPLILYVYEDKSYEEISDILRIPKKTVGTLIHRAKLKIQNYCQ